MNLLFPLRSVFLALPLEGEARLRFQEVQTLLLPFADVLRFQNPHSPHLTLFFWPQILELEYTGIVGQVQKIASRSSPFGLQVIQSDTFGNRGRDVVLFLTVAFSAELAVLKKRCPWSDGKPFEPHVTLARISHPEGFCVVKKKVLKLLKGVEFQIPVESVCLYGEVGGIKQTLLRDFPFSHSCDS